MDMIKQIRYNKINCTGCGESTNADLAAFDFGKIFAEAILADKECSDWMSLVNLDLRFYYTIRDICQELEFRMDKDKPVELKLRVKNIARQLEFLLEKPFESICKETLETSSSMIHNSLHENILSNFGTAEEKMDEIEILLRNLSTDERNGTDIVVKVPIRVELQCDESGHEMPVKILYYINDEERELCDRVCPLCGATMDNQAGYRSEFIIGLAGLARVGKTAYIASLVHQLKKLDELGFIHIKRNGSESLIKFDEEIVAEYEKGNIIHKTVVENVDLIPLVYLPLQIENRECNFVFVDMPGEIYNSEDGKGLDFIMNKRIVMKSADVIWCCVEPSMIENRFSNKNVPAKKEDSSRQLSKLVNVLNMIYNIKIPASIIVTQCDLLKNEYPLFRPEVDVMQEYILEDHTLDWRKTEEYIKETRRFVDQMNNFELSIEDAFEGITMFGVASYGFDVSGKALVSNEKIQPSMVELPFLWTLAKLGLIKVSKLSVVKGFLGKEKITSETMTDLQELYMK